MADIKTFAKQSHSAQKIERQFSAFAQVQNTGTTQNTGATIGGPPNVPASSAVATSSPPEDDRFVIEPLDLDRVRPGDLITAGFINDLIDVVIAIDTRLQRIEHLLAPLIERETRRVQAQPSASPPVAEGKP
jgi:hypothetical protein